MWIQWGPAAEWARWHRLRFYPLGTRELCNLLFAISVQTSFYTGTWVLLGKMEADTRTSAYTCRSVALFMPHVFTPTNHILGALIQVGMEKRCPVTTPRINVTDLELSLLVNSTFCAPIWKTETFCSSVQCLLYYTVLRLHSLVLAFFSPFFKTSPSQTRTNTPGA
jgi:hypothetical protein